MIERPLATLPTDRATQFLDALGIELPVDDSNLHALGFQKVAANWQDAGGPAAFEPLALFGYRAMDHRTGVAYAVATLESARGVDLKKTLFLSIAHKARAAGHDRLFVVTSNHALRGAFANFGMVFPAELQLQTYLVGWFDLTSIASQLSA